MIKLKLVSSFIFFCICVFSITSCSKNENQQLVQNYYKYLNQSNYVKLSELVGDSITVSEGSYDMHYSKNDYYQKFFQWDSVFSPKYEILDIRQIDQKIEVSVSKLCTRIKFLNQQPLVSKELFEIKDQKIYNIRNLEMNSDFKQWNRTKNDIMIWIKTNHPELDGFMYDQTKAGAQNYLKAITLYKEFKNNHQ